MVSPKHANFLINTGSATAADLEGLGEEVRRRVFEARGILLEWEICRIGIPVPGIDPIVEHYRDLSHTAPRAALTPPSAGSGRRSPFPPITPYFRSVRFSIVCRLLQQLQFVDLVKNSVDPRSNEFAS